MPKGSEALTKARRAEIVEACARLYETMSFKDITIKEIGSETSFTRTSIYNYFQTKEEIFLALLEQEYELWTEDLDVLMNLEEKLDRDGFADRLARSLEKRQKMLKLLAMNLYDIEGNSRLEKLVAFKVAYGASIEKLRACLTHFFPEMSEQEREDFIYSFFPFVYGLYPYAAVTEKQLQAMEAAGVVYRRRTLYELAFTGIRKML